MIQDVPVVLSRLDRLRARGQMVKPFTVSFRLPAVQVRVRCVAQFLALREAGALPSDIDQTIRNLYWCAPHKSCSKGRHMYLVRLEP